MSFSALPPLPSDRPVRLSVIIPVYNEKPTVEKILRAVRQVKFEKWAVEKEIIVVDDESTDGTRELLKGPLASLIDQVIFHERNLGKGAAVSTGFAAATGDLLLVQDADLEYDPEEYPKLLDPILDNQAEIVFGSRFIKSDHHRVVHFWHAMGNRVLTTISNMLSDIYLTDMETCYKVFRREVIAGMKFQERGFGFEPEFTAKISKRKYRIFEVGISYAARTPAEGKKIKWKDGFRALYALVRYNLLS
jgi:glycosyltransferase involved in cell wall biosynthesis